MPYTRRSFMRSLGITGGAGLALGAMSSIGLAPAVAVNQSSRPHAPTIALSLGAVGAEKLTRDLADPAMQDKWADAIVDGIASMLRQNRHLVTAPEPEIIPEFADVGAH